MAKADTRMQLKFSYLDRQFANPSPFFKELRELVRSGEFTLGPYVEKFEAKFARYIGVKHVIGTNTGTDALILSLKAAGVKPGDEVITVANTFYATVGAIVVAGAKPVFVDCDERSQIDVRQIPSAITPRTRAILPVHWAGCPADIESIIDIARKRKLAVIEDACQATGAKVGRQFVGTFGVVNAFSMHPLKPLNVWGDGGMIVTNDDRIASWLRLYRNHGLVDRDHVQFWGVNSRIQPFQAIIGARLLDDMENLIRIRLRNARLLDRLLADLKEFVSTPPRPRRYREVYTIYLARVKRRDELFRYLNDRGVEAKIHYPIPLHLQNAAAGLKYKLGDFPEAEQQAGEVITLPSHQYITEKQLHYMAGLIRKFYGRGRNAQ